LNTRHRLAHRGWLRGALLTGAPADDAVAAACARHVYFYLVYIPWMPSPERPGTRAEGR
jgi:hypothetical protein